MTMAIEGTGVLPAGDFPCCAGHIRAGSAATFDLHPGSVGLVELAASMRDHGKQPAQILETLLAVFAQEPPAAAHGPGCDCGACQHRAAGVYS